MKNGPIKQAILSPNGEIIGWKELKKVKHLSAKEWAKTLEGIAAKKEAIKKYEEKTYINDYLVDDSDIECIPCYSKNRGYFWKVIPI